MIVMSAWRVPIQNNSLIGLHAVIDQRHRPVLRAGQFAVRVEAQALVERRRHLARRHRPRLRGVAQLVRFADDPAALDRAAAHQDRPDAGVVVAAAGRVDLRRAAELAQRHHHRVRQQAAVAAGLRAGRVYAWSKFGATSFDISVMSVNGLRAVDVPGDLVEDRLEHVDGDEAHAALDQPAGQQAALAEARAAVAVADRRPAPCPGRTPRGPCRLDIRR